MPLNVPVIDGRTYDDLRDEALRRIPVHNPAWTNFNASDPGVTLVELFAFMTENLLYRANQIPERNRRKFLSLLGLPLQSAASAKGIATITNERGPLETLNLPPGVELRAGQVPFRTDAGMDVLPVEGRAYVKRSAGARPEVTAQYRQLYASFAAAGRPAEVLVYETVALSPESGSLDLVKDTVDGSLWIALLTRTNDKPTPEQGPAAVVAQARKAIAGRVLNLGIVPEADVAEAYAGPSATDRSATNHLEYLVPAVGDGILPGDGRRPRRPLRRASRPPSAATSCSPRTSSSSRCRPRPASACGATSSHSRPASATSRRRSRTRRSTTAS